MTSMIEFDIGVSVFSAYDADGWLGVQYDAEGEQDAGVAPYEVQSLGGMLHRPLDPDTDSGSNVIAGKGASLLIGMTEGHGRAFVLTDPRVVPLLPLLQKGETLIHGDVGNFERFEQDGTISHYTTDTGNSSGQAVTRTMGPDGFIESAPWGSMWFDKYGFRINYQPGASIVLKYQAGALPNLETACTISADVIELDASLISLGPQGVPQDQVVKSTGMLALLQELVAAIVAALNASGAPTASAASTGLQGAMGPLLLASAADPAFVTQTVVG